MRLWLYLTLIVNSIILLAFLGYGSYTAAEQTQRLTQSLEDDTRNMASSIAAGSANDLLLANFDKIEDRLLRQVTLGSVAELVVADSQGRILVQIERGSNGQAKSVYDHVLQPLDVSQPEVRTSATYALLLPIERGERLGWVRITASLSALDSMRRHIWIDTLVFSLLTVLLTGGLLALFLRKVSADLEHATEFAGDLALQRSVPLQSNSRIVEIDQLRTSLNSAAQALATQFQARQDSEAKQQHIAALLGQSEAMLSATINAALDAVVHMNSEGVITLWNDQAVATFGWSQEEAIGQMMHETIIPPQYREAHVRGMAHFLATGEGPVLNKRIEVSAMNRDGHEFPIELSITPLQTAGKHEFSAFLRDISARKASESAMVQAKEVAEQANRAKSDFLANMSHEIRTPMNGIIGMTELALDTELNAEQREYLDLVKVSANALLNIVNDILDFSKIEAGHLEIENIEFSLEEMLRDTMRSLAVRAHQKNLELLLHIAPDVPDRVIGDPGRLRQVLVNLVGNAIKFTQTGEVEIAVTHLQATSPTQTDLRFSVRDTGIGIAPEKRKAVFESFTQADTSTTRQYGGTGLGLTISTQLVTLMGGAIGLDSDLGQGSTFYFSLSLTTVANGGHDALARYHGSGRVNGLRVLIADDNATNRHLLLQMLSNWKMAPTAVASGAQALQELERAATCGEPYALAILDVQMPEMDGFELAEHIRQHPKYVSASVMMLTSEGQRGHATRCRELGVASYLMKPISQSELLDAIMTALGEPSQSSAPLITRHSLRETRRKLNVLLAEDNVVNQTLAVRLLQKLGHTVTVANNGVEALQHWEVGGFDAILMDVDMPVMNGYEATERIRALEQSSAAATSVHIPIVAMTAHAMRGARETCLSHGMDAYLSKPIDTEALWRELDGLAQSNNEPSVKHLAATQSVKVADLAAARATMDDDRDLFEEIVRLFQSDAPLQMQHLRQGLAQDNSTEVHHRAHTIKGMASLFVAERTVQAAARLEQLAAQGDLTLGEVGACAAELEAAVTELQALMQCYKW